MILVALIIASILVEETVEAASMELEMMEPEAEPGIKCIWCMAKCALKIEQAVEECGGLDAECILKVMRRIGKNCVECIECFKKKTAGKETPPKMIVLC